MASDTNSTENNPAKDSGGHLAPSTSSTSVDDATATRLGQATANDRSATQATTSDVQEEPVSAGVVGTPLSDEDAKDEEDEEGSCSDSNDRRDRARTSSPIVVSDGEQIKDKDDEGLASKTGSLPINRVDDGAAANTGTADDGAGSKGDETVLPTPEAVGVGPGRIEEGGSTSDSATETPLPPSVIATTVEDSSRRHDGGGDLLQQPSRHDISPAADDASATSPENAPHGTEELLGATTEEGNVGDAVSDVEIASSLPEEIEGVEETVSPKVPPRPDRTPVTRMEEVSDTMLLNAGGDDVPSVEESTPEVNSKTKESETDHQPPPVDVAIPGDAATSSHDDLVVRDGLKILQDKYPAQMAAMYEAMKGEGDVVETSEAERIVAPLFVEEDEAVRKSPPEVASASAAPALAGLNDDLVARDGLKFIQDKYPAQMAAMYEAMKEEGDVVETSEAERIAAPFVGKDELLKLSIKKARSRVIRKSPPEVASASAAPALASLRSDLVVRDDDDDAPMPPAQMAATYEAMEEGGDVVKTSNPKPQLEEDGDDEAPLPPAARIAPFLDDPNDKDAKKKPDLDDDGEEDCPMPDTQLASRYEEMDAALKRAIKSENDDDEPPAPGEAERIAAAFVVGDESIRKQPRPVVGSATLEPGPVPSVSVVDEESPQRTVVNDEIIGLGRGTNDVGDDPLGNSNDDVGRLNHGNNARQDEAGGGESNYYDADESIALHVPNAYLVEEDGRSVGSDDGGPSVVIIDGYAEPLLPWWKQPRTRALLAFVTSVVIVATITVASVVTSSNNAPVVDDVTTAANANTTTTLEIVRVVEASAAPSDSHAPTTSPGPSTSPTSCEDIVFNTAELLELPEFDGNTLNTLTRAEGGNAIVATRVGDSVHLVFFASSMDDDHNDGEGSGESSPRWTRTDYFVEEYGEWDADEDIYDFHVALMDRTAFVGFPSRETGAGAGAGAVYVYERREQQGNGSDISEGLWTKVAEPLLPDDGGNQGAQFGARIGVREADGLVTVTAYNDGSVYLFEKSNVSPDEDGATGQWSQLATLRLDFKPASCYFVTHDSIIVADVFEAIIHLYKYDRDLNEFSVLQDPLKIKPEFIEGLDQVYAAILNFDLSVEELDALLTQVWENGAGMLLTNFAVTDDYFAFTTSDSSYGQLGWTELGVSVYKRQEAVDDQTFALLQYFNSSDYDVGFGWELDMDKDMLIISGKNHTHVFLQQPNGYFEDTLMLNEPFDWIELSDRHLFIISRDSDDKEVVTTLNLEMCVQSMPTQMPSSSMAPSELHSVVPSPAPSFTSGPSTSTKPSHVPTFSLAPSICYDVTITIVTGSNTGKDGGVITWEFYEKNQSGDMIFLNGGGPLDKDQTYEQVVPCLMSSDFVFNITESEGKGFGECDSCGYLISVDGEYVAGNSYFGYNDVVNFPVPFVPNEDFEPCHGDFYFAMTTDGNFPERTTWVLETYEGDTVLRGGPYHKPTALYTTWSCLPDGEYNFTILDSIGDDNAVGNYVLGSDFETLVRSGLSFGTSNSTTFVSGPERT